MSNYIEFENGLFGTKAIVKDFIKESDLKFLLDKDVNELELNDGKGWRGDNIDFLKSLPNLKALTIIDFSIISLEAIHSLSKLVKIELITYSNTPINFDAFPDLIECSFEWIDGSNSLFKKNTLQKLFLNSYDKKNSDVFAGLQNLQELSILNAEIEDLTGLSSLKDLRSLRIANLKNLESLKGVENLFQLEELDIHRCKGLHSVSEAFGLYKLRKLLLNDIGNIDSLKGLENLKDLNILMFYESTNIADGDLNPITKLKSLEKISYQNRKHYTHKREQFGKLYG